MKLPRIERFITLYRSGLSRAVGGGRYGALRHPGVLIVGAGIASLAVHAALLLVIDKIRIGEVRLSDSGGVAEGEDARAMTVVTLPSRPVPAAQPQPASTTDSTPPSEPVNSPASVLPEPVSPQEVTSALAPVVEAAPPPVANAETVTVWPGGMESDKTPLTTDLEDNITSEVAADLAELSSGPEVAAAVEAPAGPAIAPGAAPVSLAGVEAGRAGRIVYAVDAGGGMTSSLTYVKSELIRSILRLQKDQFFQIVVFRQLVTEVGPTVEVFDSASEVVAATEEAKAAAASWIWGLEPGGRSSPLVGLQSSLARRPDLVFFLTRSIKRSGPGSDWAGGLEVILQSLDKLNPRGTDGRRSTIIKCLQFIDHDPTGTLPAIAAEHGDGPGSYRVITPR